MKASIELPILNPVLCRDSLMGLFELPSNVSIIRLTLIDKPSKWSHTVMLSRIRRGGVSDPFGVVVTADPMVQSDNYAYLSPRLVGIAEPFMDSICYLECEYWTE